MAVYAPPGANQRSTDGSGILENPSASKGPSDYPQHYIPILLFPLSCSLLELAIKFEVPMS